MGQNGTHQWEDKPSLREIHGDPVPSGETIVIGNDDRKIAADLLANSSEMVIQYVREAPLLDMSYKDTSGGYCKANAKFLPGSPLGVVLAFVSGGDVFIGWSRRNDKMVKDVKGCEGEIIDLLMKNGHGSNSIPSADVLDLIAAHFADLVPVEPLPFCKKDARNVAILRGLTDDIIKKDGKFFTRDGKYIPDDVQKVIRRVIQRATSYFKGLTIRNVMDAVADVGDAKTMTASG